MIVLLTREKPAAMLAAFLAGGVLISVTAGLIIVFALGGAISTKSQKSASPTVDLIAGILSMVLAAVLWRRTRENRSGPHTPSEAGRRKKDGPHGRSELSGRDPRGQHSVPD